MRAAPTCRLPPAGPATQPRTRFRRTVVRRTWCSPVPVRTDVDRVQILEKGRSSLLPFLLSIRRACSLSRADDDCACALRSKPRERSAGRDQCEPRANFEFGTLAQERTGRLGGGVGKLLVHGKLAARE